ncbi:hypothetical protein PM082_014546 [Marasmius tenuissimus]|nr:hypothetical protein PM082_014546 [Marasmius tenuissimus]
MPEMQTNESSLSDGSKQHASLTSAHCPDCSFDLEASQRNIHEPPETLYSKYSTNNVFPSDEEEKVVKTAIVEAVAQISLINNEIDRLHEIIALLGKERNRIEEVTSKYCSILRPIFRLPPEVLARIFSLSMDTPTVEIADGFRGPRPPTSLNPTKHPWALARVCHLWREVALTTPGLWSFISFTIPSDGDTMAIALARSYRLQIQLQRSADHPLTIVVAVPDPETRSLERFLSPLCYQSPRWKHLSIELHGDIFLPWMSPIFGRLQSLKSLQLKFIGPICGPDFDCFKFAPRLESIVFSADHRFSADGWNFEKLKLPYQQITDYQWQDGELKGISSSLLTRILSFSHLRAFFSLTKLKSYRWSLHSKSVTGYEEAIHSEMFAAGRYTVTLKHLVELELHSSNSTSGIHAVLPLIKAPSLQKLAPANLCGSGQPLTSPGS